MADPLHVAAGILGWIWMSGYLYTVLKLRDIPGYPINYRMLLVVWPLTAVALYAMPDLGSELDQLQEAIEDAGGDTHWTDMNELLDDDHGSDE